MQKDSKQNLGFEEFLFQEFAIKQVKKTADEAVICVEENKSVLSEELKEEIRESLKKKFESKDKEELSSLIELIQTIPDKAERLDVDELAKKNESEWYHTFRDIKEDISRDLTSKHPASNSRFHLNQDLKEFWEGLDDHLDEMILELERIFQRFPTLSRVAVMYLLAIIISLPLVFFSGASNIQANYSQKILGTEDLAARTIDLSPEAKAQFVAKYSSEILNADEGVYKVTQAKNQGKVAGAYEERNQNNGRELSAKIMKAYKKAMDSSEEIGYYLKNLLLE